MQFPNPFKRPAHTLLYITEAKTFRIDTTRRGVIKGEVQLIDCACTSANALPACLEIIFGPEQPKPGRKVWLLYSRLNTHTLSLPSVQVEGVDNDILEQALQFEYEGLTGQSLSKSHLAYQYIGSADDMSTYWVSLIARETLTKIKEILGKSHCQFGGLAHPGGLPFLLSGGDIPSWLRIECWSDSVFAMSKNPEEGLALQIYHIEQTPNWQDEVDHWILDTGAVDKSEALLNNKIEYLPHDTDENYRLSLDGSLVFWLGLWAKHLIDDDNTDIPLINPQKSLNKELLYMLGGGLSAALLCAGHFSWNLYLRNDYQSQTDKLRQAEKSIANTRKSLKSAQDKQIELMTETSTMEQNIGSMPIALAALKSRPQKLLQILAKYSPPDLVIETIQQNDATLTIKGVTLQPHLINLLANAIDEELKSLGWKPSTPTKQDMALFEQGGPWSYTYELQDLGLEGFIKSQKEQEKTEQPKEAQ